MVTYVCCMIRFCGIFYHLDTGIACLCQNHLSVQPGIQRLLLLLSLYKIVNLLGESVLILKTTKQKQKKKKGEGGPKCAVQ